MLKPVKWHFATGIFFGFAYGVASGFGLPFLTYKVLPVVFSTPPPSFWVTVAYVSVFPIAVLVRCASEFANGYFTAYCGMHVLMQLRLSIYRKLQDLPLAFYDRSSTGDLLSRLLGDSGVLQTVVTTVANDLIKQPVTLISAVGALVYLSFQEKNILFLILFLGGIPAFALLLRRLGQSIQKLSAQVQKQHGEISKISSENLAAAREIRIFNLQDREIVRFRVELQQLFDQVMDMVRRQILTHPTTELISVCAVSTAIVYMRMKNVEFEAVSLMVALYMAYTPLKKFGSMHMMLKKGGASIDRIEAILNEDSSLPNSMVQQPLGQVKGDVRFDRVGFRYLKEWVLMDINVLVPHGTVVALVGSSGAGKSTFVDLLLRLYSVQQGAITLDGKDLQTLSVAELRNAISVVSQDTFLFNDTIASNIRVGRPDASEREVKEAASHAFAHDFILALENGYQTVVGERGGRLSGGQKQRIAIARAFLKNAPILVLDEATSSLDSESEEMVHVALRELVSGKTVFIIAHRFDTIRSADKIVVFDKGRISGIGSHENLCKTNDVYRRLYGRQFS